jgi:hypothetical protein
VDQPASTGSSASAGARTGTSAPTLSLTYEVFSLPIADAGKLLRQGLSDSELYQQLVSKAKLERLQTLRATDGVETYSRSVQEYRYPTEFSPEKNSAPEPEEAASSEKDQQAAESKAKGGQSPKSQRGQNSAKSAPPEAPFPIIPTAFDTRECGDKVAIVGKVNGSGVELQLAPEHVLALDTFKYAGGLVEQPRIGRLQISVALRAELGKPCLLGTMNPWFAKGPGLPEETSRKEQDIWFCFITPSVVRDTPSGKEKAPR